MPTSNHEIIHENAFRARYGARDVKQEPVARNAPRGPMRTFRIPEKNPKFNLSPEAFKKKAKAKKYVIGKMKPNNVSLVLHFIDMEDGVWEDPEKFTKEKRDAVAYEVYQRSGLFVADNNMQTIYDDQYLKKQPRNNGNSNGAVAAPVNGSSTRARSSSSSATQPQLAVPPPSPTPNPSTSNSEIPNIDYAYIVNLFKKLDDAPDKKELAIDAVVKVLIEVKEGDATKTKKLFKKLAR